MIAAPLKIASGFALIVHIAFAVPSGDAPDPIDLTHDETFADRPACVAKFNTEKTKLAQAAMQYAAANGSEPTDFEISFECKPLDEGA